MTKHPQNTLNLPILTMQLRPSQSSDWTLNFELSQSQLTTSQKIALTRFNSFTPNPPRF
jgi:hypothetical protein